MVLGGCYKGESKGGKSALFQQPPIIKSFVAGFQHIGRSFPVNKFAKLGDAIAIASKNKNDEQVNWGENNLVFESAVCK